jgi:hypothetical protein
MIKMGCVHSDLVDAGFSASKDKNFPEHRKKLKKAELSLRSMKDVSLKGTPETADDLTDDNTSVEGEVDCQDEFKDVDFDPRAALFSTRLNHPSLSRAALKKADSYEKECLETAVSDKNDRTNPQTKTEIADSDVLEKESEVKNENALTDTDTVSGLEQPDEEDEFILQHTLGKLKEETKRILSPEQKVATLEDLFSKHDDIISTPNNENSKTLCESIIAEKDIKIVELEFQHVETAENTISGSIVEFHFDQKEMESNNDSKLKDKSASLTATPVTNASVESVYSTLDYTIDTPQLKCVQNFSTLNEEEEMFQSKEEMEKEDELKMEVYLAKLAGSSTSENEAFKIKSAHSVSNDSSVATKPIVYQANNDSIMTTLTIDFDDAYTSSITQGNSESAIPEGTKRPIKKGYCPSPASTVTMETIKTTSTATTEPAKHHTSTKKPQGLPVKRKAVTTLTKEYGTKPTMGRGIPKWPPSPTQQNEKVKRPSTHPYKVVVSKPSPTIKTSLKSSNKKETLKISKTLQLKSKDINRVMQKDQRITLQI